MNNEYKNDYDGTPMLVLNLVGSLKKDGKLIKKLLTPLSQLLIIRHNKEKQYGW